MPHVSASPKATDGCGAVGKARDEAVPRVQQDGTKIDHVGRREARDDDWSYTDAPAEAHASRLVCSYLRVDCPSAGLQPTVASVGLTADEPTQKRRTSPDASLE